MRGGDLGHFGKYVSMNILSMLAMSCYFLADTYFIANGVGSGGIVALNIVLPVFNVVFGIGHMLGIGGATMYTMKKELDPAAGKRIFTTVTAIGAAIAVLFVVIGESAALPIVRMLGADAESEGLAKTYFMTVMAYAPFFIFNNVMVAFIRNDGDPKIAMAAMMTSSLSNIVLDYVFIYPMGLGMFGAALATGLSPVLSVIVCSLHFIGGKSGFRLGRPDFRAGETGRSLLLGVPSLVGEISSGLVILLFNMSLLKYVGNIGVAAYGIIANIVLVVTAMFNGIGQGVQPLLSAAYAEGRASSCRRLFSYAAITAVVFGAVFIAVGYGATDAIVSIFNKDGGEELAALAGGGIRIYFTAFIFMGLNIAFTFYYSAVNRPLRSLTVSLLRGAIGVLPAIFILPAVLGVNGIWAVTPVVEGITFAICVVLMLIVTRKRAPLTTD